MFLVDQAAGLRARFARREPQLVPVLDSPAVQGAEGLLDALVGAYLERGLQVLVVDAGLRAPAASELARVNLTACIEALSPQVGWLDARGLILRHLDARGSAAGLAERLKDAAPQADVILVRAPAPELARLLAPPQPQSTRPVLLCDLQADNLRAAYAGMKWLRERAGVPVFALLLSAPPRSPLAERIARQLADCAERFLGAALPDWAALGPGKGISAPLRRLARDCLLCEGVIAAPPPPQAPQRPLGTR